MNALQSEAIRGIYTDLVKRIETRTVADQLFQAGILTQTGLAEVTEQNATAANET